MEIDMMSTKHNTSSCQIKSTSARFSMPFSIPTVFRCVVFCLVLLSFQPIMIVSLLFFNLGLPRGYSRPSSRRHSVHDA